MSDRDKTKADRNDTLPVAVVAEVVRSGFVESRHWGAIVALGTDGDTVLNIGATQTPIFPRSSNKPMQAVAMLTCGLDLDGELLALAAASHSGEDFHIEGVRTVLARHGLDESVLRCPSELPIEAGIAHALLRAGGGPDRLHMNCSGKHAAMIATCVKNGWPIESYREPTHPLQIEIRRTIERLSGECVGIVGVDGCGAPLFGVSLLGLARAFRAIVLAKPGTPERRVADAMRAFPAWVSGTHNEEHMLATAVPGLLVKRGAEGVIAFALPDGRAGALKIDDGGARARIPVAIGALRALGINGAALDKLTTPVLGGGVPVGEVRATLAPARPTP